MTTLNVPGTYQTIQDAVNHSAPGDTILVGGPYTGEGRVNVSVNNLTFDAPAEATGIALSTTSFADDPMVITLAGDAPILVQSDGGATITGNSGANVIVVSQSSIAGLSNVSNLSGGGGNDTFLLLGRAGATGFVDGGDGFDTVQSADLGNYSFTNVETLAIYDSVYATIAQLSAFDFISGANFLPQVEFHLRGAGGTLDFTDHLQPGPGVAIYDEGVTSGYTITGSYSNDLLNGSEFGDTLRGGFGDDELRGNGGDDILEGGDGDDYLDGGDGNDTASYASATSGVTVSLATNSAQNTGGAGTDTLVSIENLIGSDYDDTLIGNASVNSLAGGGGNDTFVLLGGAGATGFVDGGDGFDTVQSADLGNYSFTNVETLAIYDSVYATIAQLSAFDFIVGSNFLPQVEFHLRGAGGTLDFTDHLQPGPGVAIYDEGVTSGYTITGSYSNDLLNGSEFGDTLRGGFGDDALYGNRGDDILEGGLGDDILDGGDGNDTASYASATSGVTVSLATNSAQNTSGAGTDTLVSIENLIGSDYADTLTGNASANSLYGGGGNDTLDGGDGDDILDGGDGNDTASYASATSGVAVSLANNSAQDTFGAGFDKLVSIENLIGSGYADTLLGNSGANTLDGGGGADTMRGYGGDDRYFVDNSGDLVFEAAGGGNDTVFARTSYALQSGQSVEILRASSLASTVAMNLTGNNLTQALYGNAGNNVLNGGGGGDTMRGYGGDDTYVINSANDQVFETADQGSDTVNSRVSYVLAAGQSVETLKFTSTTGTGNLSLTGNEFAQTLLGNNGANHLDGGGGGDTMRGYGGDDTYVVNSSSDLVFETAGQGTDTINSRVSYVLAAGQSVETLAFTNASGTDNLNLTGNEIAQILTGNAGNNILDGGGGGDRMWGYGGDDTYVINNSRDLVFEASGEGADTVNSRVSYVLGAGQSVETLKFTSVSGTGNLNLTGNEFAQTLLGNNGNNILDGKDGADILRGYGGSDTFVFSTALGPSNIDHIVDFSTTVDTIRLDQAIFTELGLGALNPDAFKDIGVAGAVVDSSDRILYDHNTGALYYDSDGSGSHAAIQFAVLDNKPAHLTSADFFVVA